VLLAYNKSAILCNVKSDWCTIFGYLLFNTVTSRNQLLQAQKLEAYHLQKYSTITIIFIEKVRQIKFLNLIGHTLENAPENRNIVPLSVAAQNLSSEIGLLKRFFFCFVLFSKSQKFEQPCRAIR